MTSNLLNNLLYMDGGCGAGEEANLNNKYKGLESIESHYCTRSQVTQHIDDDEASSSGLFPFCFSCYFVCSTLFIF